MIYRPWYALACIILLIAFVIGAKSCTSYYEAKADAAIVESTRLEGEVDALKEQAAIASGAADSFALKADQAAAEVAKLKAKLAKIRPVVVVPTVPGPVVLDDPAPIETTETIKDQIITAQDNEIGSLRGEVGQLRVTISLTQSALDASEKRARGLEIAIGAMKHAEKTAKWGGRFQGLAVGLVSGYCVGRFQ